MPTKLFLKLDEPQTKGVIVISGYKVPDKRILEVDITERRLVVGSLSQFFYKPEGYQKLRRTLEEYVALSQQWRGKLLEEDSRATKILAEQGEASISLQLDKDGTITLLLTQDRGVFACRGKDVAKLRDAVKSAIDWMNAPDKPKK